MIDMKLRALQSGFFDRKAVVDATSKAARKVLSKFGAFVRTRASTSIRKRKGISAPMGPPHSHTGLLKRFIFFAYDKSRESVVIGPAKLNAVQSQSALPALEYGGTSSVTDGDLRRQIKVRARPFMGPALEAERPQLDRLWKDSIR